MAVMTDEPVKKGFRLRLVDHVYLVEQLDKAVDGQEIRESSYSRQRIGFWERRDACCSEKQIKARGRFRLEHTVDHCFLGDKPYRLGSLLVELGKVEDCDYERIVLQTVRLAEMRGNSETICPTTVDITVNEVDKSIYLSDGLLYAIQRTDAHIGLQNVLKTEWFLSEKVREAMKKIQVHVTYNVIM